MAKPKIAICLSGQLRQFHLCLPGFFQFLVDPLGADIFIHTWDHSGHTSNTKPEAFLIARDVDGHKRYLVSDKGEYLDTPNFKVNAAMLETIYSPVAFEIENQEETRLRLGFEALLPQWLVDADSYSNGMVDMLYSQHRAHALRRAHEANINRRYDLVINTLPDLLWFAPLPATSISNQAVFFSDSATINPAFQVSCKLTVAASHLMDIYSSAFSHMTSFFDPTVLNKPRSEWPIGERLLSQFLQYKGVDVQYFTSPTLRLRERSLPLHALRWAQEIPKTSSQISRS